MGMSFSESVRNARVQVIADEINAGTGPATLEIYSGTRPAAGEAVTDQTLLATVEFANPCTSTAIAGGVLTFDDFPTSVAVADGTATWGRITNAAGTFVADLDVSAASGGGQLVLNTTSIVTDGAVEVTAGTITDGNS